MNSRVLTGTLPSCRHLLNLCPQRHCFALRFGHNVRHCSFYLSAGEVRGESRHVPAQGYREGVSRYPQSRAAGLRFISFGTGRVLRGQLIPLDPPPPASSKNAGPLVFILLHLEVEAGALSLANLRQRLSSVGDVARCHRISKHV